MLIDYADGRKIVFLASTFVMCLGSIGVALCQSVPQLMVFRALQAFGSASGFSNSMGVIGDIFVVEERGAATGVYFGVCYRLFHL